MRVLMSALLIAMPLAANAAGGGDGPPSQTQTSTQCTNGKVWDKKKKKCVPPQQSSLTQDELYDAVRELAYAGMNEESLHVLAAMEDQNASRVLTYYGFNHRKAGRVDLGMKYYREALALDANNLLVRSYMGQAFVAGGDLEAAKVQLAEIRARGGEGGWPEWSLNHAITTGKTFSY